MSKRIITVFGATGNQGGSVVSVLLANPALAAQYAIRGVTRDPTKPSARKLQERGVEPVQANLDDPASVERAVGGAYAVFAVTNYWDTMSKSTEVAQGKAIVDACVRARVQHLVWSSLPHASSLTGGQYAHIEHFDSKAEVSQHAEAVKQQGGGGSGGLWVTHVMPGYFMSNLPGSVQSDAAGVATLAMPWHATQTHVPLLDIAADTGKYVAGALALGKEADGKFVQAVSQWATPHEVVATIADVTGQRVVFQELSVDAWRAQLDLPALAKTELGENMLLIRDYSYYGKGAPAKQRDSDRVFEAVPGQAMTPFAAFVKTHWK